MKGIVSGAASIKKNETESDEDEDYSEDEQYTSNQNGDSSSQPNQVNGGEGAMKNMQTAQNTTSKESPQRK